MRLLFSNGLGMVETDAASWTTPTLPVLSFACTGLFYDDLGNHYVKHVGGGNAELSPAERAEIRAYLQTAEAPEPTPLTESQLRDQAKAARATAVAAITVTVGGKVFDGDETAQGRIARAILALQSAGATTTNWTLADNTVVAVTAAELSQALVLAGQRQSELWPLVL